MVTFCPKAKSKSFSVGMIEIFRSRSFLMHIATRGTGIAMARHPECRKQPCACIYFIKSRLPPQRLECQDKKPLIYKGLCFTGAFRVNLIFRISALRQFPEHTKTTAFVMALIY
jgi:hypothetical protein